VGLQPGDVAQKRAGVASSSFRTAPAFLVDPKNGVSYNGRANSAVPHDTFQALENTPVSGTGPAPYRKSWEPGGKPAHRSPAIVSHYNVQPMINVYAAVEGRDLGAGLDEVASA